MYEDASTTRYTVLLFHQLLGMVAAADRAVKDKGGRGLGQGSTQEGDDQEDGGGEDRLDLSQVRLFVLDEADKLIADSGIPAVMQIFAKCPGGGSGIHRLQVHILFRTDRTRNV